jgi:hypothetical protein
VGLKVISVEYRADVPIAIRVQLPRDGFKEEGLLSLNDLWKALAAAELKNVDLSVSKDRFRALVLDSSGTPSLCTVTAQPRGNYFVRIDGRGGSSFPDTHLARRLFSLKSLPLLMGRWMITVTKQALSK